MNEIHVEEYVGEVLASLKEYQPKTERGKRAKAKWDALKEPVKIAKRRVDVTNCEKRLRAIAVKEEGKKSIDIQLTNILASICSAKGVIDEYRNRWGVEVFFKKTLLEKYQNVGIKILRREVLRKNAIMYFNEDGFELELNVKKTKEEYYEHIESINSFVAKMREKRDILNAICLSHHAS